MAEAFFDTNVLVYTLSADTAKADVAERVLAGGGHVSVQVLNEFVNVARRKAKMGWEEIAEPLAVFRRVCAVHALDLATHERALAIAERWRLGIHDATVVASATEAGCRVLWSEDFQHGQRFGTVTVRNPFRS